MAKRKPSEFQNHKFSHKKNKPFVKPVYKQKRKPGSKKAVEEKPTKAELEAKRNQLKEEKAVKQKESQKQRLQRNKVMFKKTKRGQPKMKDRIQYLLNKIQTSQ